MGDGRHHGEYLVGRNVINVRVATNQCKSRAFGQIVSDGIIAEVDVVTAKILVVLSDVELYADALPVRIQGIVFSQIGEELMWNHTTQMSDGSSKRYMDVTLERAVHGTAGGLGPRRVRR